LYSIGNLFREIGDLQETHGITGPSSDDSGESLLQEELYEPENDSNLKIFFTDRLVFTSELVEKFAEWSTACLRLKRDCIIRRDVRLPLDGGSSTMARQGLERDSLTSCGTSMSWVKGVRRSDPVLVIFLMSSLSSDFRLSSTVAHFNGTVSSTSDADCTAQFCTSF